MPLPTPEARPFHTDHACAAFCFVLVFLVGPFVCATTTLSPHLSAPTFFMLSEYLHIYFSLRRLPLRRSFCTRCRTRFPGQHGSATMRSPTGSSALKGLLCLSRASALFLASASVLAGVTSASISGTSMLFGSPCYEAARPSSFLATLRNNWPVRRFASIFTALFPSTPGKSSTLEHIVDSPHSFLCFRTISLLASTGHTTGSPPNLLAPCFPLMLLLGLPPLLVCYLLLLPAPSCLASAHGVGSAAAARLSAIF